MAIRVLRLSRFRRALLHTAVLTGVALAPTLVMAGQNPAGITVKEHGAPEWPAIATPRAGAPNVLVILTDDVGFAASSTFGGPIATPTFDALAAQGLRYNDFNTTALCSPTRAALLTGRDAHRVGMARVENVPPTGYRGYNGTIPKSDGSIAAILKNAGYDTAAFGKWHVTPDWELSQSGPFDRWPTGFGFQYYYGFMGGDSSQWEPALIENTTPIEPPHDDLDYILDRDLADHVISWLKDHRAVAPAKPFFLYYATGTAHAPQHAPADWIARYKGKFHQGWDIMREESFARQKAMGVIPKNAVLTPRPSVLPAWDSLSPDQKRVAERLMETYAAALGFADHQIGRVIDHLRVTGQLDNTLVVYIQGDNGASAEGSPTGLVDEASMFEGVPETLDYQLRHIDEIGSRTAYNLYPAGWAWAMDTPFPYYKQVASHLGGVRNGMVMAWPKAIRPDGRVRSQFHYVTDIAPTILAATGVTMPVTIDGVTQEPMDGIDMSYSFAHPDAPSNRHTQVFEVFQNLAIYHDGWWAGTTQYRQPWDLLKLTPPDPRDRNWELYDLNSDFSQSRNLAKAQPAKLAEMQKLFWSEAQRNFILPIHDASDPAAGVGRPSLTEGRTHFDYPAGLTRIPEDGAPRTMGRSFRITAEVDLDDAHGRGVILTHGGRFGGYGFYLKNGRPVFQYNTVQERRYRIAADSAITAGRHSITAEFRIDKPERGAGGDLTLLVDGKPVGKGRIDHTMKAWISMSEGMDVGHDTLTPVNDDDYSIATSRFSGRLINVSFDLLDGAKMVAAGAPHAD